MTGPGGAVCYNLIVVVAKEIKVVTGVVLVLVLLVGGMVMQAADVALLGCHLLQKRTI